MARDHAMAYFRFREDFIEASRHLSDGAFRVWIECSAQRALNGDNSIDPGTAWTSEAIHELIELGVLRVHGSAPRITYSLNALTELTGDLTRADLRPKRKPIPASVKASVLSQGVCDWCDNTAGLEIDHIVPWSQGGTNTRANLRVLCAHCNRVRGDGARDHLMSG
jgi:hypothetical protein